MPSNRCLSASLVPTSIRLWLTMTLRSPSSVSSCAAFTSTVRGVAQSAATKRSTAPRVQVLPLSIDTSSVSASCGPPSPVLRVGSRRS